MDHAALVSSLDSAVEAGTLLESSRENILALLERSHDPVNRAAVVELVEGDYWDELNDRFFQTLAFGTGGLRGRTIGRQVTATEQGAGGPQQRPEFPCVGTNAMNTFNVSRATQGLISYVKEWRAEQGKKGKPSLVFSHDTRHFSRDFAELCAKISTDLGCDAYLWDSHRPTPQMSFAIRELGCDAGVMLTASHNPAHDNGYKASFADGAQLTPPHDQNVIERVAEVPSDGYEPLPETSQGQLTILGEANDSAYRSALRETILDSSLFGNAELPGIVFTPLHGCGARHSVPLLEELGFPVHTVAEQMVEDARFPTVESANPENAAALELGLELAEKTGASIVVATDPDCDRVGVAVRGPDGKLQLLTGNQVGCLLAWYRLEALERTGVITEENRSRVVILKTFVTSYLADEIALAKGVCLVNTLTGFKWIAAKLKDYADATGLSDSDYQDKSTAETRDLRLARSKYMALGFEESYGYLSVDRWRDKDGNEGVLMFAEAVAWAASQGLTVPELLDQIYAKYGYFLEVNKSLYFEGASGAAKIKALQASYKSDPPASLDGSAIAEVLDFAENPPQDEEGVQVPKTSMLIFILEDGRRVAVRPSGTEPKIKFYLFGSQMPGNSPFDAARLAEAKTEVKSGIDRLWSELEADAKQRAETA